MLGRLKGRQFLVERQFRFAGDLDDDGVVSDGEFNWQTKAELECASDAHRDANGKAVAPLLDGD
jgi:hypothetical protein